MTRDGFIIRCVIEADLEELSTLAHRIWREHYTPIIGAAQVKYMLGLWYSPQFLRDQMNDEKRLFLVVESGSELKAYVQSSEQDGYSFIHKLYVASESKGQGMGTALLKALPTHLPLQLRVNRDNINSIGFYKRYGFEITGEHVLDIGQGYSMDDYIMEMPISSS